MLSRLPPRRAVIMLFGSYIVSGREFRVEPRDGQTHASLAVTIALAPLGIATLVALRRASRQEFLHYEPQLFAARDSQRTRVTPPITHEKSFFRERCDDNTETVPD